MRVLLAEDSVVNQMITERMLQQMDHSVAIATNGQEAVDLFQRQVFDLVLMDCNMPKMNGFEATRIIRSLKSKSTLADVPIIALTSDGDQESRDKCLNAGMNDFIIKPASVEMLRDKIEQWGYMDKKALPMRNMKERS